MSLRPHHLVVVSHRPFVALQEDVPILDGRALRLGRVHADKKRAEHEVESCEGEFEAVDREQAVAFAAGTIHLDPVPAHSLKPSNAHVCP